MNIGNATKSTYLSRLEANSVHSKPIYVDANCVAFLESYGRAQNSRDPKVVRVNKAVARIEELLSKDETFKLKHVDGSVEELIVGESNKQKGYFQVYNTEPDLICSFEKDYGRNHNIYALAHWLLNRANKPGAVSEKFMNAE